MALRFRLTCTSLCIMCGSTKYKHYTTIHSIWSTVGVIGCLGHNSKMCEWLMLLEDMVHVHVLVHMIAVHIA